MREKKIKEILLKKNEEFKKAFELHKKYEKELEKLMKKSCLSNEQAIREKELKKKKLSLKDKMYQMISEYEKSF